jgi:hypothetical protein
VCWEINETRTLTLAGALGGEYMTVGKTDFKASISAPDGCG